MLDKKMDFTRYMARLLILRGVTLTSFALLITYVLLTVTPQHLNQSVLAVIFLLVLIFSFSPIQTLIKKKRVHTQQMFTQIILDISALSALLFYTGGYTNPLIFLYLFPVLVAGLTLSRQHAWGLGLLTILAYTLLMRFHLPLFAMDHEMIISHGFKLHLMGMWMTFVLSIVLLINVIVRMSEQRQERERQLADWQQRGIRDHAMLALGAQAASDAHELGTPLNTLLLLTDELLAGQINQNNRKSVMLMQQQLLHCRHVLSRLSQRAQTLSNSSSEQISVTDLFEHSTTQWCNLHPGIHVHLQYPDQVAPLVMADPMLEQSLFILLDNATDAGAACINVDLTWNQNHATLTVSDDGSGFIESMLNVLGSEAISTKVQGKGLGLYLVRFVLEQMQGSVNFCNQGSGGARVIMTWPVDVNQKVNQI